MFKLQERLVLKPKQLVLVVVCFAARFSAQVTTSEATLRTSISSRPQLLPLENWSHFWPQFPCHLYPPTMIYSSLYSLVAVASFWSPAMATRSLEDTIEVSQPVHELSRRDNTGCVRTCPTKDDKMDAWGNWQGCKSSYRQGSGKLILEKQDQYSNNRKGLLWEHDSCWTDVVSA